MLGLTLGSGAPKTPLGKPVSENLIAASTNAETRVPTNRSNDVSIVVNIYTGPREYEGK
jgi:hypothetical protein